MIKASDFQLADEVVMAAVRLTRTLRAMTRTSRLSGPEVSALAVVVFGGPITAKALAALEEVTPGAISRTLASLEAKGLVRRIVDTEDARLKWIEATSKGEKLTRQGHRNRLTPLAIRIGALPDRERRLLQDAAALLDRLSREVADPARSAAP